MLLDCLHEIYDSLAYFLHSTQPLFRCSVSLMKSHSTNLAINEMINMIVDALDEKMYSVCVFIDLKKAFDTVDHYLLIKNSRIMVFVV